MNKFTIIKIELYNIDILVYFGDSKGLKKKLSELFDEEDTISIMEGMNITDNTLGRTSFLSSGQIILWLPSIPKTSKEKGTFAHEVFHVAFGLLNKIDIVPNTDNEEAYAYLIGYITSKIDEFISSFSDGVQQQ